LCFLIIQYLPSIHLYLDPGLDERMFTSI
jgi:hypothetical protein